MGVKKWGNDVLELFHATRVMEEDCQDSAKDNKEVNLGAGREGIDDEEAAGVEETEVLGRRVAKSVDLLEKQQRKKDIREGARERSGQRQLRSFAAPRPAKRGIDT